MLFECRRREFIRHPDFCERVVEAACERTLAVWVALQLISYLDGVSVRIYETPFSPENHGREEIDKVTGECKTCVKSQNKVC